MDNPYPGKIGGRNLSDDVRNCVAGIAAVELIPKTSSAYRYICYYFEK